MKTLTKYKIILSVVAFLFLRISVAQHFLGHKIFDDTGNEIALYKNSHALVIGVGEYTKGWPVLSGTIEDADTVAVALQKAGFDVDIVKNPTKEELEQAFEKFIEKYGGEYESRLLFYFAGHGYSVKPKYGGENIGYIVPCDAPSPYENLSGFKERSMSMRRIEEYALNIDAKHAMFIFDACFSGTVFSISRAIPQNITLIVGKPVRQLISSGSADEEVPDYSIFRRQFCKAILGKGDKNKDGYVTGSELGEFLQVKTLKIAKTSFIE